MPHNPPRPRIAIVVSDEPLLSALAFSLEAEGWDAAPFQTPSDALQHLSTAQCLLVDHSLPGMDGLALVELLRERGITAPAVIIAGKPSPDFRTRSAAAGIGIVDKPLIGEALRLQLRAVVAGDAGFDERAFSKVETP